MSYKATVYHVMISAPGDCAEECKAAHEVIHAWNAVNAGHRGIILLPVDWKKNTAPEAGIPGQASINSQVLANTDMLVAIFKHRIGTPTDTHPSGTVEEIEGVVQAGKPAMIYFSDMPVPRELLKDSQLLKIEDFRKTSGDKHYYGVYQNENDFEKKLTKDLGIKINKLLQSSSVAQEASESHAQQGPPTFAPSVSDHAKSIIETCINNKQLVIIKSNEITRFQRYRVGGQSFLCSTHEEEAQWKESLDELHGLDFLAPLTGKSEGYRVTKKAIDFVAPTTFSPEVEETLAKEMLRKAAKGDGKVRLQMTIGNLRLEAGNKIIKTVKPASLESALVYAACEYLVSKGFIRQEREDYFTVTSSGYEFAKGIANEGLSDLAEKLLLSAAEDGRIYCGTFIDGFSVKAGGLEFVENSDSPREKALFISALEDLENQQLITPTSAKRDCFEVTKTGYDWVDAKNAESQQ